MSAPEITPDLEKLLRPVTELLVNCLGEQPKPHDIARIERAAAMIERCWRSWQKEMEERFFFPFYPAKGKQSVVPFPDLDWSKGAPPHMEQLASILGVDGSLEDWFLYPSREAIDAALNDGGPVSLFETAILIGDRVLCNPAALVMEAPELFTCAWLRGEIDPRSPGALVRYSDHPGEIPDLGWQMYPEEVDAFALKRWGGTVFTRADADPTDEEAAPAPGPPLGPRTPDTLYRIIRALTLALAETDPAKFKKDGRVLVGCHKPATASGIVGHLIEGKHTDLKTTALEEHIRKAVKG